jgi:hypothetical protein
MTWTPEQLDVESDQIRQVYAMYGAAMYFAQVLEHGLVNFVIGARAGVTATNSSEIDQLFEQLFKMTMGSQLQQVLIEQRLSEDQIARLREALRTRNLLAHDYFRERAVEMLTVEGRNRMLTELEKMRAQLEEADEELEPLTLAMYASKGITPEMIEAEVERLTNDRRSGAGVEPTEPWVARPHRF